MTKTAIINLKLLAASAAFASTEEARYYICGVALEISATGVNYVATDGHRLIASHEGADKAQCADWAEMVTLIIPTEECKRAKLSKRDAEDAVLTLNGDGSITIAHDITWTFKPVDGTYPGWRRALPRTPESGEVKAQSHWDYAYAMSFRTFAEKMGYGSPIINQRGGSSPMPVTFAQEDCNSFGVLVPMLMRGSAPDWEVPAWVNSRQSKVDDSGEDLV